MATTLDIVERSLRKAAILAHGDNAEAADASAALEDLNMMLAAWKLAGVDTEHTAITLADPFPLGAEYEEGTVHMLAARISPDYLVPVAFDADDFFRKIQAAYMVIAEVTLPKMLTSTTEQRDIDVSYTP